MTAELAAIIICLILAVCGAWVLTHPGGRNG